MRGEKKVKKSVNVIDRRENGERACIDKNSAQLNINIFIIFCNVCVCVVVCSDNDVYKIDKMSICLSLMITI